MNPIPYLEPRIRQRGMALVIVLAMLVLLTGLVVAFFSAVTGDSGGSAVYSNDGRSKQLSESVVNLVMGQIIEATKGFKTSGGAPDYTQPLAWASQPGAIRTFDNSGSAVNVFKLYSAQSLVENGTGNFTTDVPSTWATDNGTFTDLNAPVKDEADKDVYPIVDPTALGAVQGFSITNAPTAGTTNTAPMPVRWLYQLKDGTLATATGNGPTANVAAATTDNPIVGRIAFWTDDETCKVNINTASEGTYWDTPRFGTGNNHCPFETALALAQPVRYEFQRYPGHPAMTSLAPVFFATSATATGNLTLAQRNALYNVAPRIRSGGSDAGSTTTTSAYAGGAIPLKTDRLYASVDELRFSWNRYNQDSNAGITTDSIRKRAFFLTASSRAPEVTLFNTPRVSIWPTSSAAKDSLNRPLRTAFDNVIRFCSSLGVDSAGNPLLYGFQRLDSKSSTADWTNIPRNRQILLCLQRLTAASNPIPGFGGSFETKLTAKDRDQLLVEILDYVRCTNLYDDNLTPNTYATAALPVVQFTSGRQVPPAISVYQGHSFVTPLRVPSGFGNSVPASTAAAPDKTSFMGFGRYNTITEAGLLFICNADGSAGTTSAPIDSPSKADGYDAIRRLSNQAANVAAVPPAPALVQNKALNGMTLTPTQKRVQAMILFKLFSPSAGYFQMASDFFIEMEQVGGSFAVQGQNLGIPSGPLDTNVSNNGSAGLTFGGVASYRKTTLYKTLPARGGLLADSPVGLQDTYEFVGAPVTVDTTQPMDFTGPTKLVVRLFRGTKSNPGDLMQTIEMNFPSTAFPIPDLVTVGTANGSKNADGTPHTYVATDPKSWWTFHVGGAVAGFPGRMNYQVNDNSGFTVCSSSRVLEGNLIRPEDTLRTLVPYHGDYRLLAGSHFVPLGVFQPSLYYFNSSNDRSGNPKALPPTSVSSSVNNSPDFWFGNASTQTGSNMANNDLFGTSVVSASAGNWGFYFPPASQRLVPGANYITTAYQFPDVPVFTLNGASVVAAATYQIYGDFDNPVANLADGPYINKPDEGNTNGFTPYYNSPGTSMVMAPTFFSPARIMPGPGMLGSLPVKLWSGNTAYTATNPGAWRTLLFRPQSGHPGASAPADHLLLDLFWMPVVEPYAISDPLSTAGKINMNYAMAPFSYIRRATGIVSALRSERVVVVPLSKANAYKGNGSAAAATPTYRQSIDENETLKGFDARFAAASGPNIFLSPSEICTLDLIPSGSTYPLPATYWSSTNALTGDNSRERAYTTLQTRLTTKSNTFTVHYRVQVLKKASGTSANQWVEGKDNVASESRGSTLIERYVDPNDPDIPDFATQTGGNSSRFPSLSDRMNIDNYYRFRVVQSRKFAP
jgi:uncharacterized protein (TIGR02600 family)